MELRNLVDDLHVSARLVRCEGLTVYSVVAQSNIGGAVMGGEAFQKKRSVWTAEATHW